VFVEDWNNFQYSFLGVNSVTIIQNGASARIVGLEGNFDWAATQNLLTTLNFEWDNAYLTSTLCSSGPPCPSATSFLWAPHGTKLPVTPQFKGSLVARYGLPHIADWEPYAQGSWMYQASSQVQLRTDQAAVVGKIPAYALVDFRAGATRNKLTGELYLANAFNRNAQLSRFTQTAPTYYTGSPVPVDTQPYVIPAQPRTIGVRVALRF
jgi:iron complex outermembrane receptor protein